jgi:TM2 domain-containing membrane protein YozV
MALVHCPECKHQVSTTSDKCTNCGAPFVVNKNKFFAAALAFFFGWVGVHRFYLRRPVSGVLYLAFFWTFIPFIFSLLEFFELMFMGDDDFKKKYCQTDLGRQVVNIKTSRWMFQLAAAILWGFIALAMLAPKNEEKALSAKAGDKASSTQVKKKSETPNASALYKMTNGQD